MPVTIENHVSEVARQVEAALRAFPAWRDQPIKQRRFYIRQLRYTIVSEQERVARTISEETGKPVVEVLGQEVTAALEMLRFLEQNLPRLLRARRFRYWRPGFWTKVGFIRHEPMGVLALIGPSNFPFSLLVMQAAQALLCGNCVMLKPSERCPGTAYMLRDLFQSSAFPDGVVRVVEGDGRAAQALIAHEGIKKVFFTGSYEVGRDVAAQCGRHFKPCVLELGGEGCALVDSDADLEVAAPGIVWSSFYAGADSCVGTRRVYVHTGIARRFLESVLQEIHDLDISDLTHAPVRAVEQSTTEMDDINQAIGRGATLYRMNGAGDTGKVDPAVLFVPADLPIAPDLCTSTPLLIIREVASMEEAIRAANESLYGLSASIWSRDGLNARRIARRLNVGIVWINDASAGQPQFPWGGTRRSGWGRVFSRHSLNEMTHLKVISHDRRMLPVKKIWWFPYLPEKEALFSAANQVMYSNQKRRGLIPLIRSGSQYGFRKIRGVLSD